MDDWAKNFKDLLSSPFGEELVRSLKENVHDNLIREAENVNSQEVAYGLLKEARGVIKAIEHLQFRSDTGNRAVAPKDEGGKVK